MQIFRILLCLLYIHAFETIDWENELEAVVCERCGRSWAVDRKQHTMEPLKEVA